MKISGVVKKGTGRGRKMGFPTANIAVETDKVEGVYFSLASIGDMIDLPSLTFIGVAETFGEKEKGVEVYILDFRRDIYGKAIRVELLEKIRSVEKFQTASQLIKQMKKDEEKGRKFFKLK